MRDGAAVVQRVIGCAVLFFIMLPLACGVSEAQRLPPGTESYIDSLMQANYPQGRAGAVALVACNGVPLYRKAFGLANVELGIPNKPEYAFAIGSMSKQFTAACILQLSQAGKLRLDDDVRTHLPEYNTHGRTITIEHLLTHTSGIPGYTEQSGFQKLMREDKPRNEIMGMFMRDSLLFEPGSDWSYSNSGYFLAAMIVESVSGMPFGAYLHSHVFEPAGMMHTHLGTRDRAIPGFVSGYDAADDSTSGPADYMSWNWLFGTGEIISTVDDLLRWDEALYGDVIVGQDRLEQAWRSCTLSTGIPANYGYGWTVCSYRGLRLVAHGGAVNGFRSDAIRIPDRHLYVTVLSNSTSVNLQPLCESIALRAADAPLPDTTSADLPVDALRDYSGMYAIHRMGTRLVSNFSKEQLYRSITVKNDTLWSQRRGGGRIPLRPIAKDLFVTPDGANFFRFQRDARSVVAALEIYMEPLHYGPREVEAKVDLPLPPERKKLALGEDVLSRYAGTYDSGGGMTMRVTVDGGRIYSQSGGWQRQELFAASESRFYYEDIDMEIEFLRDENGAVDRMIIHHLQDIAARKVE